MSILFSILIPAYKSRYLNEAMESVLAQTYQDWEMIIVDDHSPEDLVSIVRRYKDNRISYYRNGKNIGACDVIKNWNKCLSYAKGEYIICMGDDDKLFPDCLENYAQKINQYPEVSLFHTQTIIIDENSSVIDIQIARPEWESVYSLIWHRWNCRHKQYIGDFLFKTASLKNNGGFFFLPYAWFSDEITSTMLASERGVVNLPTPGFMYRMSRYTISEDKVNVEGKLIATREAHKWFKAFLQNKPTNSFDIIYFEKVTSQIDMVFDKWCMDKVVEDINNLSICKLFFWLQNGRKYDLNSCELIKMYFYITFQKLFSFLR